jgi:tetratricopeptide (TPR) repeat protein
VRAENLYKEEVELYKKENNTLSLGITLNNLGFLYAQLGRYKEAEAYLLESIRIARQLSSFGGLVANLDSLATLYLLMNMPIEAELAFQESLEIAQRIDYVWYVPFLLNGLAKALYQQGKLELASQYLHNALTKAKATKNEQAVLCGLTTLAMIKIDTDEFTRVDDYLLQALSIAQSLDAKSDLVFCLLEATKYLGRRGNVELSTRIAHYITNSPVAWKVVRDAARELLHINISNQDKFTFQMKLDIVPSTALEKLLVETLEANS